MQIIMIAVALFAAALLNTPDPDYTVYLPSIHNPHPNPVAQPTEYEINTAVGRARYFVATMTQPTDKELRGWVTHEYPALPIWILVDGASAIVPGGSGEMVEITYSAVTDIAELSTYRFWLTEDKANGYVDMWADRDYEDSGNVNYFVKIANVYNPRGYTIDVYLSNTEIMQGIKGGETSVTHGSGAPAFRYTLRHASALAVRLLSRYDFTSAGGLRYILEGVDYTADLYDPLFGLSGDLADDVFFTRTLYPDCDGIFAYPVGVDGYPHYPYRSKVCTIGIAPYIALTRADYLVAMIQAIHVINTTGNPDAVYNGRFNTPTTPRAVARWVEGSGWNGYGVAAWGKDPAVASSVRTDVFSVLETLLGYKYGDAVSQDYADRAVRVLIDSQWTAWGNTADNGQVLRPQFQGAQMIGWITNPGNSRFAYQLPPRTLLTDLVDLANMPDETASLIIGNAESTLLMWQALRVYAHYAMDLNFEMDKGGLIP